MKRSPRRKKRRGWLSGMKSSSGRGGKTSLLQWVTVTPLLVLLVLGILLFVYLSYFNPSLVRGEHLVRTKVLDRVVTLLPDGKLDVAHSHLLVRIENNDIQLRPVMPQWDTIEKGDLLETEVGRSTGDGSPVVYSYKKIAPDPTGSP